MFKNLILRTSSSYHYHHYMKSSIKLLYNTTKLTNLIRECSSNNFNYIKPKVNSKKNRNFVTKEEKEDLESLGLEKYAELFEENLNSFKSADPEDTTEFNQSIHFNKFIDQRVFKELKLEDFETIYKDNLKLKERIKRILTAYEIEKYNTSRVPTELSINDMYDLLNFDENESDVLMHLKYLFNRESRKAVYKMKHLIDKEETEKRLLEKHSESKNRTGLEFNKETGAPLYAKWKNTMFIAFNRESLRKENDRRVKDAALFGPKLVLDFGYDDDVFEKRTFSTLNTQILFTQSEIISAKQPFHLNLCGLRFNSEFGKNFQRNHPYFFQPNCLHTVTEKSHLELFPRNDLIFLSADAPKTLTHVDPDKIYIIGAMCDKYKRGTYSYQKAMHEKLPVYKLPLDDYFFFKHDRVLPMNLVIGILCRYLETQDWRKALVSKIPIRKLKTPEELRLEQIRKVRKYHNKEKFFKIYRMNEENQHVEIDKSSSYKSPLQNRNPIHSFKKANYNPNYNNNRSSNNRK